MPIVHRVIVYEGTEEQLAKQMAGSLKDGTYAFLTRITVDTITPDAAERGRADGWWPSPEGPTLIVPLEKEED